MRPSKFIPIFFLALPACGVNGLSVQKGAGEPIAYVSPAPQTPIPPWKMSFSVAQALTNAEGSISAGDPYPMQSFRAYSTPIAAVVVTETGTSSFQFTGSDFQSGLYVSTVLVLNLFPKCPVQMQTYLWHSSDGRLSSDICNTAFKDEKSGFETTCFDLIKPMVFVVCGSVIQVDVKLEYAETKP